MKANELRIGNWVIGKATGKYINVGLFFLHELWDHRENGDDSMLDWYKPIPLTPEILEKSGFEHLKGKDIIWEKLKISNFDEVWWISGMYFIAYNGDWIEMYHCTDEDTYWQLEPILEHLHQLQNLYFALTGEELNINL